MVDIRRCEESDVKEVQKMISEIMSSEFSTDQEAYPFHDLQDIMKTYGGLGEAFFVAVHDNHIIGTIGIKKEDDRIAFLRRLFVIPEFRKKKISYKLIDRALKFCDEVGYQEIVFKTTSRMERAIQVCQNKGFVQRASTKLGPMELLKFTLLLENATNK